MPDEPSATATATATEPAQKLIVAPAPPPTPAPSPAAPQAPTLATAASQLPIVAPFLALLNSRKGIVILGAIGFCMVVYLRDPSKLDKILNFLTITIPVWLGAQSWEDGKKHEANGNGATHNGG